MVARSQEWEIASRLIPKKIRRKMSVKICECVRVEIANKKWLVYLGCDCNSVKVVIVLIIC